MNRFAPIVLATLLLLPAQGVLAVTDILGSWNGTDARRAIVDFVDCVTSAASAEFIAPPERIAVFDNDGTLWCEYPLYPQFVFGADRARTLAGQHPEWQEQDPYKSALAGDLQGLAATGVRGLIQLTVGTNTGMTPEEFQGVASNWVRDARHPRFQKPYTQCVYKPMIELLTFLRENQFKTYIVTGGSAEFVRPWCYEVYGIPPEQVIGSTVGLEFETTAGKLVRARSIDVLNDREQKAISIQQIIGRRPVFAFGNSDGDLPMLEYTAGGRTRSFSGFVHHTDAEREYAYDRSAKVGRLDKGLEIAKARGWVVVDMARDWIRIFPFER